MKQLRLLHISLFWILLPLQSKAIIREIYEFSKYEIIKEWNEWWKKFNGPSKETQKQFTHLYEQFNKISEQNWGPEKKVTPDDTEAILTIIANIKSKEINKPDAYNETFLKVCIEQTSHYPEAEAEKITKKLLEKGADIALNPYASYSTPYIAYEAPLWSAALSGNVGAYNAMIDHAQETHLLRPHEGKILKLPRVINVALKRLEIMEDYYKSELQKVKNGERKGYTYSYFNRVGSGSSGPYEEYIAVGNLEDVIKLKNQFQKMQNINTQHYSENHNTSEHESLIIEFLEERIPTFNEYKHSKIYTFINGIEKSLK